MSAGDARKKIIVVFIVAATALFLRFAGPLLVVDEPPHPADAVIILGGDKGGRVQKGAELYKAGYAPILIFSDGGKYGNLKMADIMVQYAVELGVPPQACLTERHSKDTYGNAYYARKLMEEYGLKSALVVSSPYHMQRTRYVFNRLFTGSGIALTYVAADAEDFNADKWWEGSGKKYVIGEYVKLVWYCMRLEVLNRMGYE